MSNEPESEISKVVEAATKKLVDDGHLVEAGWLGFVLACKLKDVSDIQRTEMRRAFFGGALHLFSSMMSFLEPGHEATDKDLDRMTMLSEELKRFENELRALAKKRN